jgi:hypothetical protein
MKWRMVDAVLQYTPWDELYALKVVSFEERTLLERWGRPGEFPASLCVEWCVEAARWLTATSSDFALTAALDNISGFRLARGIRELEAGPHTGPFGDSLSVSIRVDRHDERSLDVLAHVHQGACDITLTSGALAFGLVPLAEHFDRSGCAAYGRS